MAKVFAFGEYTYTFLRKGSTIIPVRSDGAMPFSTYSSFRVIAGIAQPYTAAYAIWFPTVAECKSFVDGSKDHGTFTFQPVWARTADEARRVRDEADNAN